MLKKPFSKLAESKYLFYSTLFINVILICFTKFYPSMDGPAHLYNSNILLHLIKGNQFMSEFYSINSLPVPNWTSHAILVIFHSFLPAWIAEKILLVLYVSGMALSFRYLINVLNPKNISLSILVFPFIYSFLFHLGLYNFCLSFIFLFTTIAYFIQSINSTNPFKYPILFLLILISYFTNPVIFCFSGLTMGLYIIYFSSVKYADGKDTVSTLKYLAGKLFILLILSTPGILFMILFYANVQFHPAGDSYSAGVLIKWINDARPFIVFNYTGEEIITEQFFHILLVLLALSFILKNRDTQNRRNLEKINILAIPLLLSIFLYFITPNGSGAGMMSDRYGLILYFFGLIWIVSRSVNIKFNHVIIFLVLILHFGLHFKHLAGSLGKLDANAISINEAGKSISENSIVLPVNLSDHWLELHFSNYSGTDKPIIILENYEAGTGWFPVRWNSTNFPNIRLNDKDSISGLQWMNNRKSGYVKEVDYILIYGNPAKLDNPEWSELKEVLSAGFTLKYRAENDYVLLYKRSY